jgi:hypothetical protein
MVPPIFEPGLLTGAPRPCPMGMVLQSLVVHQARCRLPADVPASELRESWAPMERPKNFNLFGKPGRGWRR